MDLKLAGKRALVTGSSEGIGAGAALMLAQEGAHVVINGRREDKLAARAAELAAMGLSVSIAPGDMGSEEGVRRVAEAAGEVDILVCNSGGAAGDGTTPWLEITDESWARSYEVNVLAAGRIIRRVVPGMKERGWGRIIQIASAAGTQPPAIGCGMAAAKAAMINATVSLSRALAGTGITVNTISPGIIRTPAVSRYFDQMAIRHGWEGLSPDEISRKLALEIFTLPAGQVGTVEDIGLAVCMLASPRAGYMTGANIRIDGGQIQSVN